MKNRFLAFVMAATMLVTSSCVSPQPFDKMDEKQFIAVVQDVESVTFVATTFLKSQLKEGTRLAVLETTGKIRDALVNKTVTTPKSFVDLLDLFSERLLKAGVTEKEIMAIKTGLILVQNTVGRIDFEAVGDSRSEQVILAVLRGLQAGLS